MNWVSDQKSEVYTLSELWMSTLSLTYKAQINEGKSCVYFPLHTYKEMEIPLKVELCPVCKFDQNYCPLFPGCPMETVVYPRNTTSRKKRKYILIGLGKLTLYYLCGLFMGPQTNLC